MDIIDSIRSIYGRLADDISKDIFWARMQYEISKDGRYLTGLSPMQRNIGPEIERYYQKLNDYSYTKKVIIGAGFNGQCIVGTICSGKIFAFIDNYRKDERDTKTNLPIYTFDRYFSEFNADDTQFIISVGDRTQAELLLKQLKSFNIEDKNIVIAPTEYRNNNSQYFDVFLPQEHESFVDCGCFDGSSAYRFAGWCADKGYDKIWCFEPDTKSYENCIRICSNLKSCIVYPYGLGEITKEVFFTSNGREDSRICEVGSSDAQRIQVVSLDELLGEERVTFIKMDIEGEELSALKGASDIIRKQHPRLAISVYHRQGDFINIPMFLLDCNPEYKFYLRHYSMFINETVLYAI